MKLGLVFSLVLLVGGTMAACGGSGSSGPSAVGGTAGASTGGSAGASTGGGTSGGTAGTSSGGGPSGGAAGASTGGAPSGGAAGTSSGGTGGGTDPLAECKAQAASNPNPACANCACDNCLNELVACEQDPTCTALRNCAQQNNCCDELCVLFSCGAELQAAGGIGGPGATKAIAVRDCTEQAQCNCCGP